MANRRMFSLDVVDTDIFLDLPISSQALYFHLGMRADDDGFVSSPRRVTTMIGANQDDLKLLIAKGFIIALEEGVVVIRHWKQNNYIQNDRRKNTIYQSQLAALTVNNGIYEVDTQCIQTVSEMDTQDRLGKDSIDKGSIDYHFVADMYNATCVSFPKLTKLSDKRKQAIKARFNQGYTVEDFRRLFELAEDSSFLKGGNNRNWQATFDWMIADANMAKTLDGNYSDRQKEEGGAADGANDQSRGQAADFYERYLGSGNSD